MRLTVKHTTTYHYDLPQKALLQSHRLRPSEFAGQTVVDWTVDAGDAVVGCRFRDGAGDDTWTVRVPGPVEEVTVTVSGTVETTDLAGVLRGHREKVPPMAYLRTTRVTRADLALQELGETALADLADGSPLDRAHALATAVEKAIVYKPDITDSHTTAAEALAGGEGVCQDHAHALIAVAISQNIPARYVAGYLFASDPDDAEAPRPSSQASHAWAELHIDGLGWIGFDPANGCCPDDRYIRLCSGYDAFDAAPIRGMSSGIGEEALNVVVAVMQEQQ